MYFVKTMYASSALMFTNLKSWISKKNMKNYLGRGCTLVLIVDCCFVIQKIVNVYFFSPVAVILT